jgi:hypothetical protein
VSGVGLALLRPEHGGGRVDLLDALLIRDRDRGRGRARGSARVRARARARRVGVMVEIRVRRGGA